MTAHQAVVKDVGRDSNIRASKLPPRRAAPISKGTANGAADGTTLGVSSPSATSAIGPKKEAWVHARSGLLHVATFRVAQQRPESSPGKPHGSSKGVVDTVAEAVDSNYIVADRQALDQRRTPTGIPYSGREVGRSPLSTGVPECNASLQKVSPSSRHAFTGGGEGEGRGWRATEGGARQREVSFDWDRAVVVGSGGKGGRQYQPPDAVTSQPVRCAENKNLGRSGELGEAREDPAQPPSHEVLAWLSCICCCCPIGAIAILRAREVPRRYRAGDHEGALRSSIAAHKWSVVAIGVGLFFTIIRVGLYFLYNKYSCTHLCLF